MGCAYPTDYCFPVTMEKGGGGRSTVGRTQRTLGNTFSPRQPPPPRRRPFSCRQPRVGSSRVTRLLPTSSSFMVANTWWAEKNIGNHEYLKRGVLVQSDGLGPVVSRIYLLPRGRIKPGEKESRQPDTPLLSRDEKKKRISRRERTIWEDRRIYTDLGKPPSPQAYCVVLRRHKRTSRRRLINRGLVPT